MRTLGGQLGLTTGADPDNVEADDTDWFAGLMGELGEEAGVKLFRRIAATNGFSARKGHTLLTNLVAAGEAPLALTVFNYTAEQLKKRGAPIEVTLAGEFIGVLHRDDDEGEVSYALNITILEEDLPKDAGAKR